MLSPQLGAQSLWVYTFVLFTVIFINLYTNFQSLCLDFAMLFKNSIIFTVLWFNHHSIPTFAISHIIIISLPFCHLKLIPLTHFLPVHVYFTYFLHAQDMLLCFIYFYYTYEVVHFLSSWIWNLSLVVCLFSHKSAWWQTKQLQIANTNKCTYRYGLVFLVFTLYVSEQVREQVTEYILIMSSIRCSDICFLTQIILVFFFFSNGILQKIYRMRSESLFLFVCVCVIIQKVCQSQLSIFCLWKLHLSLRETYSVFRDWNSHFLNEFYLFIFFLKFIIRFLTFLSICLTMFSSAIMMHYEHFPCGSSNSSRARCQVNLLYSL